MNGKDAQPNYKQLYAVACEFFNKTNYFWYGTFDETFFSMRVFETAKMIISKIKQPVKENVVLTATLLHDIGKSKIDEKLVFNTFSEDHMTKTGKTEFKTHPKKSVPLAEKVLNEMGHSKEFITDVCYLIENHDQRGDKMNSRSIELQIMQDADLVSDCGVADLMRNFAFAGGFKKPLIHSIRFAMNRTDRVDEEGNLNLTVSKKLAKKRTDFYNVVVKNLAKELDSELL